MYVYVSRITRRHTRIPSRRVYTRTYIFDWIRDFVFRKVLFIIWKQRWESVLHSRSQSYLELVQNSRGTSLPTLPPFQYPFHGLSFQNHAKTRRTPSVFWFMPKRFFFPAPSWNFSPWQFHAKDLYFPSEKWKKDLFRSIVFTFDYYWNINPSYNPMVKISKEWISLVLNSRQNRELLNAWYLIRTLN